MWLSWINQVRLKFEYLWSGPLYSSLPLVCHCLAVFVYASRLAYSAAIVLLIVSPLVCSLFTSLSSQRQKERSPIPSSCMNARSFITYPCRRRKTKTEQGMESFITCVLDEEGKKRNKVEQRKGKPWVKSLMQDVIVKTCDDNEMEGLHSIS